MKAKKNGNSAAKKAHHVWGISLRTGLLGIIAASVLLLGVSCTRNGGEDGTVADSNVGSVTSSATEKDTKKDTEAMSEPVTERRTDARTDAPTEPGSGMVTTPGTMPGTGEVNTSSITEHQTSATTVVPGTMTPGTAKGRNGKG